MSYHSSPSALPERRPASASRQRAAPLLQLRGNPYDASARKARDAVRQLLARPASRKARRIDGVRHKPVRLGFERGKRALNLPLRHPEGIPAAFAAALHYAFGVSRTTATDAGGSFADSVPSAQRASSNARGATRSG